MKKAVLFGASGFVGSFLLESKDINKRYDEFDPLEKHAPLIAIYFLAQAYNLDDNFNDAIASFTDYKDQAGPNESDRREVGRSIDKSLT